MAINTKIKYNNIWTKCYKTKLPCKNRNIHTFIKLLLLTYAVKDEALLLSNYIK